MSIKLMLFFGILIWLATPTNNMIYARLHKKLQAYIVSLVVDITIALALWCLVHLLGISLN